MNIILTGYIVIFLTFIIALLYLIFKAPKPGLAITVCCLMILTGIFILVQDRATKLIFKGIGTIELAEKQVSVSLGIIDSMKSQMENDAKKVSGLIEHLDSMKSQMENDAKKVSELRKHLDSMFTIDSSGHVQLHKEIELGPSYWGLNPGKVLTSHMNISSDSPDGTTHGIVLLQIGGYNMITATRDSDGAGDSDTPLVSINGVLELTPQDTAPLPAKEGMIYFDSNDDKLKVYNGSSWKVITKD